jgi:hypothetical protein
MRGRQNNFQVRPGSRPSLKNFDAAFNGGLADEEEAGAKIETHCGELATLQDRLMAEETHAHLVILQALDGSGKVPSSTSRRASTRRAAPRSTSRSRPRPRTDTAICGAFTDRCRSAGGSLEEMLARTNVMVEALP